MPEDPQDRPTVPLIDTGRTAVGEPDMLPASAVSAQQGGLPAAYEAPRFCAYCGGRLTRGFYFCLTCGTPFQNPELVLPYVAPLRPTDEQLIQRKAPHAWPLFWSFAAVLIGTAVLCALLFKDDREDLRMILTTTALFITTCIFGAMHWRSLWAQFMRPGFTHWAAWAGLAILVPVLAVNYGYHGWITQMLPDKLKEAQQLKANGLNFATMLFFFCITPAILEEIAFRGLLQHWLQVAITPLKALVLASALFAAMHFSVVSYPYLFGVGMLLGWVKWNTGSLYPGMVIHFIHNFVVMTVF